MVNPSIDGGRVCLAALSCLSLPSGSAVKYPPASADVGLTPGSGRSPGEGNGFSSVQFSHSVRSDSATPQTAARQASLSITNSQSLLKLMSIESVMASNHLILCRPLLLLLSIFPSIRVFSNESTLHIRGPTYWLPTPVFLSGKSHGQRSLVG